MSIQPNEIRVEVSSDGSTWSTVYLLQPTSGGVSADFAIWAPPYPGTWFVRLHVTDNNLNAVGRTSLVAMCMNR